MTILTSLYRAYGRLADAAPFGMSLEKIGFLISLNDDGTVAGMHDMRRDDGKKSIAQDMPVPQPVKRTAGIAPNFLWDKTAYVLGVTAGDGKRVAREHAAFKEYHCRALANTQDTGLLALFRFLSDVWTPEKFAALGWPEEMKDQNIAFTLESERLAGTNLHDRAAALALWARLSAEGEKTTGMCLVTGEVAPIARLHPAIKGVWGAQSSGASIVSFNLDAFTSYGHEQGFNAPVSEAAASAYTAVLNAYLKTDGNHCIQIADTAVVFWAEGPDPETTQLGEEIFASIANPDLETQSTKLGAVLTRIRKGEAISDIAPGLEESVRFYVLGLAPNASRLSVRYWFDNSFHVLAKNIIQFYRDMRLEPSLPNRRPINLFDCVLRTAPARKGKNDRTEFDKVSIPDQLAGELFRAFLTGGQFPLSLLALLIQRIRSDHYLDFVRVSLIKALIVRNRRLAGRELFKEDYLVSADPDDPDVARRFGRYFALVEKAQRASLGNKVNSTVRDKYFGSAAVTPRRIFPILQRMAQPHLARLRKGHADATWVKHPQKYAARLDRRMGELVPSFNSGLPTQFGAEDQGKFYIGYYQERYSGKSGPNGTPKPADDTDTHATNPEPTP